MAPAQVLLLVAVLLGVVALARAIRSSLHELEPAASARPWPLPFLQPLVLLLAHFAGRRLRAPWRAALRTRLLAAGFGDRPTPPEWFALRCLVAASALLPVAVAGWLRGGALAGFAAVPAALLGAFAPEIWLRGRIRRRSRRIDAHLALHLEMLLAGLEAGLEGRTALRQAAHCGPAGAVRQGLLRAGAEAGPHAEVGELLRRVERGLHAPAACPLLGETCDALAGGTGLRSALHRALVREEGRRLARAESGALWRPAALVRPLLAGTVPALLMLWSLAAWP
ncbi:MAG: hypothetical protein U1F06_00395 [Steroidobacteraceae bacterium]